MLCEVAGINKNKMNDVLTFEVEVNFPDGQRTITMIEKAPYELDDCEEGKVICLNLRNNETHTGIFKGMDGDEDIMLGSLSGKHTLGYKVNWLVNYLEEVRS